MCSIAGYWIKHLSPGAQQIALDLFAQSVERGKDSFGIAMRRPDGSLRESYRRVGDYSDIVAPAQFALPGSAVANFRAEPTTEYVPFKTVDDIQPFIGLKSDHHVVHNGTIRNDKDLRSRFGFTTATTIDSAVIPYLYDRFGEAGIDQLIGSWAIAILESDRIFLARNYKPIWLYEDPDGNWFFGSLPNHLPRGAWEMDPYSTAQITANGFSYIHHEERKNKKAVVICSGGLDSVVTAYVAKHVDGMDVRLIHFKYGCVAETHEDTAIRNIARHLGVPYTFLDLDFLKQLGGSPIIDGGTIAGGEAGAEFATEWVPARNAVFLSLVAAYCDRWDIGNIYMGLNLEEGSSFPDNGESFHYYMEKAFDVGTMSRPRLHSPFLNKVKHEIVAEGLRLNVPMGETWSCYRDGDHQCGDCGPCYMRMNAFKMNGVKDPAFRRTWGDSFWDGCLETAVE